MPPKSASAGGASTSKECNIQVFVRCRPRNDREVKDSREFLQFAAPYAPQLTFAADRTNKTYTFDGVFAPGATQEDVFRRVAAPILSEVLQGYNCTIFAYGQTGTGKTHTMEGNIEFDAEATPDPEAGLVPRVLHTLFAHLDTLDDYEATFSALELYNEELYDLQKVDGLGRPATVSIRDDGTGIAKPQDLTENQIFNVEEALKLLRETNNRRKVAATALNAASSRSHCIFTLKVTTRKRLPGEKEELALHGRLNLVDLAGSENVERSKVEKAQAREAGMINKSLLNLGRVINALVNRQSHIPYRESKLTRLLQDSLGGRAKTAIIATVSPARETQEETFSTLEYASRARDIRNRPEVNQTLNKKELLIEYARELAKLRAELQATRDRNGIHLPPEVHAELIATAEQHKDLLDRYKDDMRAKDDEVREERERHAATKAAFERAKLAFSATKQALADRSEQVRKLQGRATDDRTVLMAVSQRERALRDAIDAMANTISAAAQDVESLHGAIDQARSIVSGNAGEVQTFSGELVAELRELARKLGEFNDVQVNLGGLVQSNLDQFMTGFDSFYQDTSAKYSELTNRVATQLSDLASMLDEYGATPFTGPLRQQIDRLRSEVSTAASEHVEQAQSMADAAREALVSFGEAHTLWSDKHDDELGRIFSLLLDHLATHTRSIETVATHVREFQGQAQAKVRAARDAANQVLEQERQRSAALEAKLVDGVTTLIADFARNRMAALAASAGQSVTALQGVERNVEVFAVKVAADADELSMQSGTMDKTTATARTKLESSLAHVRQLVSITVEREAARAQSAHDSASSHAEAVARVCEHHGELVDQHVSALDRERTTFVTRGRDHAAAAGATVQLGVDALQHTLKLTNEAASANLGNLKHQTMVDNCQQLVTGFSQRTSKLEDAVGTLVQKRLRDADEVPRPAKRRHIAPAPETIPAPLNRQQILGSRSSTASQDLEADTEGDVRMSDACAGSVVLPPVDAQQDPQALLGAESVDVTPPAPVPATPVFTRSTSFASFKSHMAAAGIALPQMTENADPVTSGNLLAFGAASRASSSSQPPSSEDASIAGSLMSSPVRGATPTALKMTPQPTGVLNSVPPSRLPAPVQVSPASKLRAPRSVASAMLVKRQDSAAVQPAASVEQQETE